jgi:hypothetical protein
MKVSGPFNVGGRFRCPDQCAESNQSQKISYHAPMTMREYLRHASICHDFLSYKSDMTADLVYHHRRKWIPISLSCWRSPPARLPATIILRLQALRTTRSRGSIHYVIHHAMETHRFLGSRSTHSHLCEFPCFYRASGLEHAPLVSTLRRLYVLRVEPMLLLTIRTPDKLALQYIYDNVRDTIILCISVLLTVLGLGLTPRARRVNPSATGCRARGATIKRPSCNSNQINLADQC